ncbi:3-phosphoshikimate 1-carboxyvinyltransferase [Trinickia violacea]|uniref:3-phosphoshikimate 1-carboxyvinyltransferase n=1 Tax=Trinickia violacea TaxID=2571746 RepID=A0A4P8J163_9BURK|nr:3-phosphoshikimate 1-carboxyvinyltransferase [Trinickia violacea]QCP54526.1 3-phosphoshikimate 1-carboxyvinyltransferase [Trinickia violacea]
MSKRKYIQVSPLAGLTDQAAIPSSKPETQRAILAATLARGRSIIRNDLRCVETTAMKNACRAVGAKVTEADRYLIVDGVGREFSLGQRMIDAIGSGLVFRVFTALTCFSPTPAVITGDAILRGRVMAPLFEALSKLGANIECIAENGKAPIVNWGGGFEGGRCDLPGNVSSQFITAIMFAAPLAKRPTEIHIHGEILSISYIRQTAEAMRHAGIEVDISDDFATITVHPGEYQPFEYQVYGDYTSSSYLVGAAALFKGTTTFSNVSSVSLQGERAIVDVIRTLGLKIDFDDQKHLMTVVNEKSYFEGDFEFDASDYPNIVPTLAAIGSFVKGRFRVVGGSITRLHKSPRIKAMVEELTKLGVDIKPIFRDGVYDGFEIHGNGEGYAGGQVLSSWGDHRIFMSLFIASLRCRNPNHLDGYSDVNCSFPDFFEQFSRLGVQFREVNVLKVDASQEEPAEA